MENNDESIDKTKKICYNVFNTQVYCCFILRYVSRFFGGKL